MKTQWRDSWRRLPTVAPWRYLIGLLVGTLGVVAVLIEVEWPVSWWYEVVPAESTEQVKKVWVPWLGSGGALAAAITAFAAPIKGGLARSRSDEMLSESKSKRHLAGVANTVFAGIPEHEPSPERNLDLWQNMTVRCFIVDRSGEVDRLELVAESRNHARVSTGIEWVAGKGTVGLAWKERRRLLRNLRSTSYMEALKSSEAWEQASPDIRQNLEFAEASRLAEQPYGAVAAYPVSDVDHVFGVVSIDVPPNFMRLLKKEKVIRHVERVTALAGKEFRALWELRKP